MGAVALLQSLLLLQPFLDLVRVGRCIGERGVDLLFTQPVVGLPKLLSVSGQGSIRLDNLKDLDAGPGDPCASLGWTACEDDSRFFKIIDSSSL